MSSSIETIKKSKKMTTLPQALSAPEMIENKILFLRGRRVMLDRDLAVLYGVPTKVLIQAVKRNRPRFPPDFMFQLTKTESQNLRSQFVTSSWGGTRYLPRVFTELGVAMLSSVLNSELAIQVNIAIMRVFVRMKEVVPQYRKLVERVRELEKREDGHEDDIQEIFLLIDKLEARAESEPGKLIS